MSRKQVIILAALAIFVVAEIVIGFLAKKDGGLFSNLTGKNEVQNEPAEVTEPAAPPIYSPEVPKDAKPSKPSFEAPAAPNSEAKLGIFEMKIDKNGYEPKTLTVKKGDLLQIKITAVDGDYDLSIPYNGIYQSVKKGETKEIGFGLNTSGTFFFECRDFCPASGKIKGEIIVIP